jgi:hypothetical protein
MTQTLNSLVAEPDSGAHALTYEALRGRAPPATRASFGGPLIEASELTALTSTRFQRITC